MDQVLGVFGFPREMKCYPVQMIQINCGLMKELLPLGPGLCRHIAILYIQRPNSNT
jgi:hypothetical protein